MFIKKFYDADVADAGGGEAAVAEPVMTAAQAMAQHGKKSDENSGDVAPIEITEKKEEAKKEEPVTAATATSEVPKEEAKAETPKAEVQAEEPKKVETQPIVAEPVKVPTLDEVLKANQPDTVLKALGYDDEKVALVSEMKDLDPKVVGIIQAYKNGTLGEYAQALSTDYTKMSDEDVMRHQLRKEYPKVSDAAFEALFEDEVLDKYKLDSDVYSEAERAKGKLLLEAKAAKYRDELVANQEKYLMPKPPEPKAEVVPDNSVELQAKENVEKYVKEIENDPYTKDIIANKKITLGEGEEKFSYPVDYSSLIGNLTDAKKWVSVMYDKDTGAPRTSHQLLVAAVAEHGMEFLDAYAKHFKGLGAKEVVEPIDNASPADKSTPAKSDPLPTSAAQAMAKSGVRRNSG